MYIDTHTHLNDPRYQGQVEEIVNSFAADGIDYAITVGYDNPSSKLNCSLADKYERIYGAVAIHPHDSRLATDADYAEFAECAKNSKIVAIGETGLDYHYDHSPREIQQKAFVEHLELAHSVKLPVIIHLREAYEDMLKLLKQNKALTEYGALLHCYSGSADMVREYLKLGLYISFAGPVTFKNAKGLIDSVRAVPLDKILTETDCPYLTPEPHRGKLNYPAYVKFVAEKLAGIKEIDIDTLTGCVSNNAKQLFKRIK